MIFFITFCSRTRKIRFFLNVITCNPSYLANINKQYLLNYILKPVFAHSCAILKKATFFEPNIFKKLLFFKSLAVWQFLMLLILNQIKREIPKKFNSFLFFSKIKINKLCVLITKQNNINLGKSP